ncbi:hypothetical protein SAMN05660297_02115 [Natronincola peptidivorans]|uniref:4Fe-4S ferredoxin-type domain-containing protein n=1 Tax=Natronincola peptidivorans TaxID=426128 RepID=A0A1I0DPI9_9FIRM|nr:4Fe-4S dicluster domain-containing protein [Natronincola peptidivorans]SET34461.1 hypothetical protein SAMN05660297_02115 [Natronincola peptidivorans]
MKIVIVVFSPGGHTKKVAEIIKESMEKKSVAVEIIDTTGKAIFDNSRSIQAYLKSVIPPHDILMVGAPVYAHHFHYNVLSIIDALPSPGNGWGKFSIPFVTYGTINSGISLYEAGNHLNKTGRKNIFALKIDSFHVMSRFLSTTINEGKPGKEIEPLMNELADKIISLDISQADKIIDILPKLNYQKLTCKIKANTIFREKFFQDRIYPQLSFNKEKCVCCQKCIKKCPVQRLLLAEDGLDILKGNPACIHCGECIHACEFSALDFKTDEASKAKWNKVFNQAIKGKGILPSNEFPKTVLYY